MVSHLKNFIDLTRLHFAPVWPLLFCSGAMLGFETIGKFSWISLLHIALIGFLGGTGGIVLNDYVDREYDKKDIETDGLTRYWRPFGRRPIAHGQMKPSSALLVFWIFTALTVILIFLLPFPQFIYVLLSLSYCYLMEVFYQLKKRNQNFPVSQLLGRTDFALFPAAGFMAVAGPEPLAFIYMLVFYPLAQVHLGVNDLADVSNDEARGMKSIPLLYGNRGTAWWIVLFSVAHISLIWFMVNQLQEWAAFVVLVPLCLLATACIVILSAPVPKRSLRMLPLIHATIALEAVIIIVSAAQRIAA